MTYALLCDLVRQENNGKFIAIGIYSSSVVIPSFPAIVQFTILAHVDFDAPGLHTLKFRVKVGEQVVNEGEGQLDIPSNRSEWVPIPLQPIQFLVPTQLAFEQQKDETWSTFLSIAVDRGSISATVSRPHP